MALHQAFKYGCSSRLAIEKRLVPQHRACTVLGHPRDESLAGPGPSSLAAAASPAAASRLPLGRQPLSSGRPSAPARRSHSRVMAAALESRPSRRSRPCSNLPAAAPRAGAATAVDNDTLAEPASPPPRELQPLSPRAGASGMKGRQPLLEREGEEEETGKQTQYAEAGFGLQSAVLQATPSKWRRLGPVRSQVQQQDQPAEQQGQPPAAPAGPTCSPSPPGPAPSTSVLADTAAAGTFTQGTHARPRPAQSPDADRGRVSWGFGDAGRGAGGGGKVSEGSLWAVRPPTGTANLSRNQRKDDGSGAQRGDGVSNRALTGPWKDEAAVGPVELSEGEMEAADDSEDTVTDYIRWPDGRQLVEVKATTVAAHAGGALSRALGVEQRAVVRFNGGPGGLKGMRVLTLANIFMGQFARALSFVVDVKPWTQGQYDVLSPQGNSLAFAYRIMGRARAKEPHDRDLAAAMRQSRFVLNMSINVRQAWQTKGEVDEELSYDLADTLYGALSAQQAELDAEEEKLLHPPHSQQRPQQGQQRRWDDGRRVRDHGAHQGGREGADDWGRRRGAAGAVPDALQRALPPCVYISTDMAQGLTAFTALGVLQRRLRQEAQPAVVEATLYRASVSAPRLDNRDGFVFAVRLGFEAPYLVPRGAWGDEGRSRQ